MLAGNGRKAARVELNKPLAEYLPQIVAASERRANLRREYEQLMKESGDNSRFHERGIEGVEQLAFGHVIDYGAQVLFDSRHSLNFEQRQELKRQRWEAKTQAERHAELMRIREHERSAHRQAAALVFDERPEAS